MIRTKIIEDFFKTFIMENKEDILITVDVEDLVKFYNKYARKKNKYKYDWGWYEKDD